VANAAQGIRGAVASTNTPPTRKRSPIRTSAGPKLESVRFSPNVPGAGAAPSSPAHQA
jgi:hypothetical protein